MRVSLALLLSGTASFLVGLALLSVPVALIAGGAIAATAGLFLNVPDSPRG